MDDQKKLRSLETEYRAVIGLAEAFSEELAKQLAKLIDRAIVPLAFPIQRRVKRWESLSEKFARIALSVEHVKEVQDLIGLRVILLFRRDVEKVDSLLRSTLKVSRAYNTGDRLKADQFGYSSRHYIVALPEGWLGVPSFDGMSDLIAEIQVRTLAQHMWAEASNVLQYKREESVPVSIRRALSRGSAILETLDLEFDRVLDERDAYRTSLDVEKSSETLNVDLLEKTLDVLLPPENKSSDEPYAQLLSELSYFGITTATTLRELAAKHIAAAKAKEEQNVTTARANIANGQDPIGTSPERTAQGVFFTHIGLARMILSEEVGDEVLSAFWKSSPSKRSNKPPQATRRRG